MAADSGSELDAGACGLCVSDAGEAAPTLFAGVATVDITPTPGIDIVGFGTRASTAVRDPLEASVLVLRKESLRIALVTLDLPGISDTYAEQLRSRVAIAISLPFEAVFIVASHTHSAPMFGADAWTDASMLAIASAAERAAAQLIPVSLALGEGMVTFDVNRRLVVDGIAEARPDPEGPRDGRVRTAVFLNRAGEPVALLSHVVCHANVLLGVESTVISADFPGEARERLTERFGVPWLFIPGAAGDVRPMVVDERGEFRLGEDADLERLGAELAAAVITGVEGAEPAGSELAFGRDRWSAPTRGGDMRGIELSAWRMGPLAIVTIPGEPLVDVGLTIERGLLENAPAQAWVVGYANGYASYIVTEEAEAFGGYEVARASLPASATAVLERRLITLGAGLF